MTKNIVLSESFAAEVTAERPILPLAAFFEANAAQVKEYIPVNLAQPMEAGETVRIYTAGSCTGENMVTKEKGYFLAGYDNKGHEITTFIPERDFEGKTVNMDGAEVAVSKKDFPPGTRVTASAVMEGAYDVRSSGQLMYTAQSHYTLHTHFNFSAEDDRRTGVAKTYAVVALRDEKPLRGIVLAQDEHLIVPVLLRLPEGPVVKNVSKQVKAGSFIYEDPAAPGGYAVADPDFTRYGLRRRPVTPPARQLEAPKA